MQIAISELDIEIDGVLLSHRLKRSLLDRILGAPSRLQAPLHIGGMTLQLAFFDDFGLTANIDLPSDLVVDLSIVLIASENTPRATAQPYDGELMMFGMNCRAPIQMNKTVIPRGLSARGSSLRWEGNGLDVPAFLKNDRGVPDSQPRCFFEIVTIGFSLSLPAQGPTNAERQHRSHEVREIARMVTIEEARARAEARARERLSLALGIDVPNALDDDCTELDNCFVFFRRPSIELRPEQMLWCDIAYLVSKNEKQEILHVGDLRGDPGEKEYHNQLVMIVEYLKQKQER